MAKNFGFTLWDYTLSGIDSLSLSEIVNECHTDYFTKFGYLSIQYSLK